MEFSGMVARPAKNPEETRNLITEMERKRKMVEDVTGEDVSENHAKSVLVGILDPTTRQHTAMYHGSKASCEQLKKRGPRTRDNANWSAEQRSQRH